MQVSSKRCLRRITHTDDDCYDDAICPFPSSCFINNTQSQVTFVILQSKALPVISTSQAPGMLHVSFAFLLLLLPHHHLAMPLLHLYGTSHTFPTLHSHLIIPYSLHIPRTRPPTNLLPHLTVPTYLPSSLPTYLPTYNTQTSTGSSRVVPILPTTQSSSG